ncbi:MAG TPA: hypothetical protein VK174_01815 [Chitinophagales bacterium]|nr:hypothetical protein [Chitinophagales bacterium]HLP53324.1 hypothetical protein [Chitinophagales bacterium]
MKKILFALMAVGLMASASSCKKCGYCKYANGSTDAAVCKNTTASALGVDGYKEAETNCEAAGGTWIVN